MLMQELDEPSSSCHECFWNIVSVLLVWHERQEHVQYTYADLNVGIRTLKDCRQRGAHYPTFNQL